MFTDSEVNSFNACQQSGLFHPLTCGNCRSVLIANNDGLYCPNCDYKQDWTYEFMKDWDWVTRD